MEVWGYWKDDSMIWKDDLIITSSIMSISKMRFTTYSSNLKKCLTIRQITVDSQIWKGC